MVQRTILKCYDKYENSLMMARVVSKHVAVLVTCEEYISCKVCYTNWLTYDSLYLQY